MRDVYFYYGTGGNIHCRNGSREATKELANGDSRDKAIYVHGRIPCAFVRLRRPKAAFRDLLMTFDRLCRYSLSLAFCAENAALALHASALCRMTMQRGRRSMFATFAPAVVKNSFNTMLKQSHSFLQSENDSRKNRPAFPCGV